jgi:hypothetical protein
VSGCVLQFLLNFPVWRAFNRKGRKEVPQRSQRQAKKTDDIRDDRRAARNRAGRWIEGNADQLPLVIGIKQIHRIVSKTRVTKDNQLSVLTIKRAKVDAAGAVKAETTKVMKVHQGIPS